MNKTVLISANTSWYLYNFRKGTIKALLDLGYKVVAVSPKDQYVSLLEGLGAHHYDIRIDRGGTNPVKDALTFISFLTLYISLRPRVILSFTPKNNIYGSLAARLLSIPTVNNIAGLGTVFINDNFLAKLTKFLYRISIKKSKAVFFQNNEDMSLFLNDGLVRPEQAIRIPGSGVDLSRFLVHQAPDNGVTRFILVARMLYDKGIQYFVDSASLLKEKYGDSIQFYLLGPMDENAPSGIQLKDIDRWQTDAAIIYLGTTDSVEDVLKDMDCMVLPSYYREGVPKSLLEGASMGKPIITTDNVGCREVVDHGVNGFLCEPRSTVSLVEQIEKFIALPYNQKLNMGKNSRFKVENEFDEKIVIKKYLEAIENILQHK